MAVLASLWLSLPTQWAALGTFLYGLACLWQWTQLVATRWKYSIQALRVDVYGRMSVTNRQGQRWIIQLLPDSVVHHACLSLHIAYLELLTETTGEVPVRADRWPWVWPWLKPQRLLILPDQADEISQQALHVWLKWGLREPAV